MLGVSCLPASHRADKLKSDGSPEEEGSGPLLLFYVLAFGPRGMWDLKIPDQGSNPHPLHWKTKSQPLDCRGSPGVLPHY